MHALSTRMQGRLSGDTVCDTCRSSRESSSGLARCTGALSHQNEQMGEQAWSRHSSLIVPGKQPCSSLDRG